MPALDFFAPPLAISGPDIAGAVAVGLVALGVVLYLARRPLAASLRHCAQKLDGKSAAKPCAPRNRKRTHESQDAAFIGWIWCGGITLGLLGVVAAVSGVGPGREGDVATAPGAIFTAVLWALGCLVIGSFLGFLFGVPKIVHNEAAPAATGRKGPAFSYQANTALEQVADWLTKMVVGIGLVELRKAPGYLVTASRTMSASYGNHEQSPAFGIAVIVYFSLLGFLGCYLITRLYLQAALLRSDTGTLGGAPGKANLSREEVIALREATIGFSEKERALSGLAALAAAKLLREVDFAELETAQDFALWGKAQLHARGYAEALAAYTEACKLGSSDVAVQGEGATALYLAERDRRAKAGLAETANENATDEEGEKRKAAAQAIRGQLVKAYRMMNADTWSDLRRSIFKNLTYVFLYDDEKTGNDFEQSIRYGEEYILNPRHVPSGGLYFNLACAYGQKVEWHDAQHASPATPADPEREAHLARDRKFYRDRALEYMLKALKLDATWEVRFRKLLQKDFPGKSRDDRDLEPFEEDPEFRAALHLSPAA